MINFYLLARLNKLFKIYLSKYTPSELTLLEIIYIIEISIEFSLK